MKLFSVSNEGSVGLGIKWKLSFLLIKFKTFGEVVKKEASIAFILSKILFLFFSKSGPFLFKGSRNHWAILIDGLFFFISKRVLTLTKSACPRTIKSGNYNWFKRSKR